MKNHMSFYIPYPVKTLVCKNPAKKFSSLFFIAATLFASVFVMPNQAAAFGWVSRSCIALGAQESITWDVLLKKRTLYTGSDHFRNERGVMVFLHGVRSTSSGSGEFTAHSYAGHIVYTGTGEYWIGRVVGYHWERSGTTWRQWATTQATDCNAQQWGLVHG